ncbi:MAG: SIS domain-containing protein [Thermoplasmata archaeon]|nr:SIS domain-containing protein [Thermoplasmata archaeon]
MTDPDPALQAYVQRYVEETDGALRDAFLTEGISRVIPVLRKARDEGRTVYFFGNGGSASTASHMAQDIAKLTIVEGQKRFRTHSLADHMSVILAVGNDVSFSEIYAEQIKSQGRADDVAIGISGSGNSPNVLRALEEARKLGMTTVGFIGTGGGKMKALCDVSVIVPSSNMQHIEDLHHILLHLLASYLRDEARAPPHDAR